MNLLEVRQLSVLFAGEPRPAVDSVSFDLESGGTLGVVGESGSGKTQLGLALLGLNDPGARVEGSIRFDGRELANRPADWRAVRGSGIGMVFQNPASSLNPYLRVGAQLVEVLVHHRALARAAALAEAARLLDAVQIAEPARRLFEYPHQFSGGMRQRVMLALALAARPRLLVADEPTTALDVTVQAQILDLIDRLRREFGLALLLVSHDLSVVARCCERLLVLRAGCAIESGATQSLLRGASDPYTRALLRARG